MIGDMLMEKPLVTVMAAITTTYHDQYQILAHSHYQIIFAPLLLHLTIIRTGLAYATRYSLF
jgi:hypothetical protein